MRVFVAPHSADAPAAAGGGTGRRAYWQEGALAGGRWGGHTGRMLHMTKLSVGTRDLDDMRAWQAERIARGEQLKHRTRSFPRRAAEIVGEGSIYWVISGSTLVRQLIVDIVADHWEDGSACAAIHLDPVLCRSPAARRVRSRAGATWKRRRRRRTLRQGRRRLASRHCQRRCGGNCRFLGFCSTRGRCEACQDSRLGALIYQACRRLCSCYA